MLPVPYFKQDRTYSCGPTCLQMVCAYFHLRVSEEKLTRVLRANNKVGTPPAHLVREARLRGLHTYTHNHASLAEIRFFLAERIPVIVYFLEPTERDDHYAVVVAVRETEIVLQDPYLGEHTRLPLNTFESLWAGKKRYQPTLRRWLLALSVEPLPLGEKKKPRSFFMRHLLRLLPFF